MALNMARIVEWFLEAEEYYSSLVHEVLCKCQLCPVD